MIRVSALAGFFVLLWSCGLETYSNLDAPSVPRYQDQTDYTKLELVHDPSRYAGTNFIGYEVYYKIYQDKFRDFTNLVTDAGKVANSPKLETLRTLGYQRVNSNSKYSAIPILSLESTGGIKQTVTLDFRQFLTTQLFADSVVEPELSVSSTGDLKTMALYRTLLNSVGIPFFAAFSDLGGALDTKLPADMDSTVPLSTTGFEIDFFVVGLALSPETFEEYYSVPAPWGIISGIKVRS